MNKEEMFMRLKGEEYSQRLESYSDSTISLIMALKVADKATVLRAADITTDSELSEEQVVQKLKKLKSTYETGK